LPKEIVAKQETKDPELERNTKLKRERRKKNRVFEIERKVV
jgi:hypothetical protein